MAYASGVPCWHCNTRKHRHVHKHWSDHGHHHLHLPVVTPCVEVSHSPLAAIHKIHCGLLWMRPSQQTCSVMKHQNIILLFCQSLSSIQSPSTVSNNHSVTFRSTLTFFFYTFCKWGTTCSLCLSAADLHSSFIKAKYSKTHFYRWWCAWRSSNPGVPQCSSISVAWE